ncbi:hypothetical protein VE00_01560 [Pseudogymnoascus sp. WSF 3629]|nr:hypothetical protein VE00_01560 [Pseudogymnoascus sp. WSF 3629]
MSSYASSTYSYSTTASTTDTIRDAKQSSSSSASASKTPSKKESFLQKTKKVFSGPSPEKEAARKEARTPTQAMMEKTWLEKDNLVSMALF